MLENLIWYKLSFSLTYKNLSSQMKSHYISTFSSVIKSILEEGRLSQIKEKLVFHFNDLRLTETPQIGYPYQCEIIIAHNEKKIINFFTEKLVDYLLNREHLKNITISKDITVTNRNLDILRKEKQIFFISNEIVLDFYSPFDFSKYIENHRTLIRKEHFLKLLKTRIESLFNLTLEDIERLNIQIYPYYWHYTYFKHFSKSQYGHIQYIQGCIGPLLIRGDIEKIIDLILLTSELHIGNKKSNSQGYFKIRDTLFLDEIYKEPSKNLRNYPFLKPFRRYNYNKNFELTEKEKIEITEKILINTINRHLQLNSKSTFTKINEEGLVDLLDYNAITGHQFYIIIDKEIQKEIIKKNNIEKIINLFPSNNELFLKYLKIIYNSEDIDSYQSLNKIIEFFINNDNADAELKISRFGDVYLIFFKDEETITPFLLKNNLKDKLKIYTIFEKNYVSGVEIKAINFDDYQNNLEQKALFVKIPNVKIKKSLETIVIQHGEKEISRIPLNLLSDLVILSPCEISSSLILELEKRQIGIFFVNKDTYITTKANNSNFYYKTGIHFMRYNKISYEERVSIAKEIIRSKIMNYQYILFNKKFSESYRAGIEIGKYILKLNNTEILEEILGIEGVTTKIIFDTYRKLILNKDFQFTKRDPLSKEPFNIILNFVYSLLAKDINIRLRLNDINPYLGFLHSPDNKYESLVYDILELFRCVCDRLVLKLVNLKIVRLEDFITKSDGSIRIDEKAVLKILKIYYRGITENKYGGNNTLKLIDKMVKNLKNWIDGGEFKCINFLELKKQ